MTMQWEECERMGICLIGRLQGTIYIRQFEMMMAFAKG
jgi:hypothetical protein